MPSWPRKHFEHVEPRTTTTTINGDGTAQAIVHEVTGHMTCSMKITGPNGTVIPYSVRDCMDADDYGSEIEDGSVTLSEEESGSGEYRADADASAFSRTFLRWLPEVPNGVEVEVTIQSH